MIILFLFKLFGNRSVARLAVVIPAEGVDAAKVVGHFINGADVADNNRPLPVTNPATGAAVESTRKASFSREMRSRSVTGRIVLPTSNVLA